MFFILFNLSGYSQYSISGYISTKEKNKTIFLSLLRYNEENAIYPEQILISTKTDSTGYFEFTGKLLLNENKFYRGGELIMEYPLLDDKIKIISMYGVPQGFTTLEGKKFSIEKIQY